MSTALQPDEDVVGQRVGIRISIVCISLRSGGTERIVSRIANHFSSRHDVNIITLARGETFFALEDGVQVSQPSHFVGRTVKPVRVLLQLAHVYFACRRLPSDLCLIFGEDISGPVTIAARLGGVLRAWVFFRGSPERSLHGVNGLLNPVLCGFASRIIVQTRSTADGLLRRYRFNKISVWSNPIEMPEVVRDMRARQLIIVNVGSIGRLKNQEGLLRIYHSLERREQWHLLFIGDGPKRVLLEQQVEQLGMRASVQFCGQRKDVGSELGRASIFAFTSLSEGFPNALAEALAAGCACVSYDCPTGPSELIQDGVNGFLVPLGDESLFALRLQQLIDDESLRSTFSAAGRDSMRRYEASATMQKLEAMIAAGGRKRGRATCDS
ncbi:glycosyltransferase [Luteimonas sp. MC1782]|uniref:glycosyltransferase n=1 Tax=Luteimonas sp. MC1782 TaxID=2760305 RepID=UPI001602E665|nr:glycosyltransferase [Luteimonas sp. MC1782]MBB1472229.1 glycosyltransferase [Luteimonas sp. MC1782]